MVAVPPRRGPRTRWRVRAPGGVRLMATVRRQSEQASLMAAAPGLFRLGVTVGWRITEIGLQTSLRVGGRVVRGAAAGESPTELLGAAGSELRGYMREF